MLLRTTHYLVPHFMGDKEIPSYVSNFDSMDLSKHFCKGSQGQYFELCGPYSLFATTHLCSYSLRATTEM
jgi:hypothetical protein